MKLIVLFLLLSLGANAQIIRANPFYVPKPSGITYLLDAYPNAAAAYSLRKLKSSYSGSAIRIRRDSTGNAETDIGFTANGDLDTAAIKNHCRNNSCMLTTWYNQGDSTSVNFTQTTAASQPRIVNSGVIERNGGEPTINFHSLGLFMSVSSSTAKFSFLHKSSESAVFAVNQFGTSANPNGNYILLDNANFSSANTGFTFVFRDVSPENNQTISIVTRGVTSSFVSSCGTNDNTNPNQLYLFSNLLDNGNATIADRNFLYINSNLSGGLNAFTNTPSTGNASFNLTLGRAASTTTLGRLIGNVSELIIYSTDQSSNRTGIETNINNYYGLW